MFCVHSAAVLCGREATHLAMSQFIPFMSLPWEIFVLKPSRSWLGFTLGGECSRVQVGGRRRKMGPWWAGTGMPDVPVRNGPKLRAAFLPLHPLSWHYRWQTCKGEGTHLVVTVLDIPGDSRLWLLNYGRAREATLLPWPVAKKCWNWDATGERGRRRMPPHLRNLNSPCTNGKSSPTFSHVNFPKNLHSGG